MASSPRDDRQERRRQSIPLQTLNTPFEGAGATHPAAHQHLEPSHTAEHGFQTHVPGISTYWDQPYGPQYDGRSSPESPIDPSALQAALPPDLHPVTDMPPLLPSDPFDNGAPYSDETPTNDYSDSDRYPLTSGAQPMAGTLSPGPHEAPPRDSFQTVSDLDNSVSGGHPAAYLGRSEYGLEQNRTGGFGMSLSPNAQRITRSPSTAGALLRAGSIVRAMSQRVVNISGESETMDQRSSRHRSRSPHGSDHRLSGDSRATSFVDTSYRSQAAGTSGEKSTNAMDFVAPIPDTFEPSEPMPNPLKGRSLGIFSPDSPIRQRLCDLLIHPYAEPVILLLIVFQAILLAVESAPDVFSKGHGRPERWGGSVFDWIMLGLFIVFTLELGTRIIVSGLFLNAAEYSTIDRKKGVKAAVAEHYRAIFQPQRAKSVKGDQRTQPEPSAFARSFTTLVHGQQRLPETLEEQQRFQLARRAFLRHGFNRLDFVAVGSFWISFLLSVLGLDSHYHLYVFRMLSCLRILKLLALTHGTAIILRSLKKAAPLLVRVAFFISFFWLLFAIIGLQAFKASLSRQCVWLDPLRPRDLSAAFTNDLEFCGGYLDNSTGATLPWVKMEESGSLETLINGTANGKGFLCPRGSICLQQENPFNGTVNFDNIIHSLELVFVIMSANTFSDLMYYTMGSDHTASALFFGAGIMFMTLWLTNLLIAVITSSFQVIREESKASAFTVEDEGPMMPASLGESFGKSTRLRQIYDKTVYFWILLIAFSLASQASRTSTMSDSLALFIRATEIVTTILLDIEMIIRIIADGRRFHRSKRNLFDLFLALVTTIILIPPIHGTRAYPWLSVFQILRVYRIVLAIPITRKLIMLVLGNAAGIANLMLFVFLMTFLVAILAAQLFRGEIPVYQDGELNRVSFHTIFNSFLGMYQVLTSENWTEILYSVTSYTTYLHTSWIGAAFLIGWFILSFFILINMFIAVIQENFDVSEDEKRLEQVKAFLQRKELGGTSSNLALSTIFSFGRSRQRRDPLDYGPAMTEMLLQDAVVREFLEDPENPGDGPGEPPGTQRTPTGLKGDVRPGVISGLWGKLVRKFSNSEPNPFYSSLHFESPNDTLDARQMAQQAVSASSARRKAQREYLTRYPNYNTSLYIFQPRNRIRRLCQRLVGPARGSVRFDGVEPNKIAWYTFSIFIYAAIVAMVAIACVTTPLFQKQYQHDHPTVSMQWYVWTDLAFSLVFTFESVVKIIADGLIWTPNAYLRSSWGLVDAVVLITLWINVVTLLINDGAVSRAIGAFKAFRALRLLNVSDSARDTFHSLIIVGWWKITGAAFVSISLLIPFAIYGLNLFNGLLVSCNDSDDIYALGSCFGEYNSAPYSDDWPFLAPRVAANPYFNFDDFGASLFTLFQIVSQEGWTDVSFAAQAITGRGRQPQDMAAQGNAVFFVIFNLLATVFVLTLFISVFMRNYTEQTGVAYLTAEQRSWLELRKLLRQISPSKSSYKDAERTWRRWCHKRAIEKRGKWYQAVTVVLVLHLILLMVEFSDEPAWWQRTRSGIFLFFILIYIANIAIRISGLGWTRFRRSSWDLYSLVSVFGAFLVSVAVLIADLSEETYAQVHKVFLVSIVLLIIPRNDALDQLFKTAAASLTVIGNLLATWLVLFLAFAIAMTQAFSLTRFGGEESSDINFRTVPKALILLFRMSLGEGWNQVMEDYAGIEPPLCVDEREFFNSDCGSKAWARFLFVAWNLLSMYIFVNLFVSLIYESFSYVYQRSSGMAVVDRDEIRRFKEAWRNVDPNGVGFISKEAFPRLLGEMSGIFQMRIYDPEDSVGQILEDVQGDARGSRHMSLMTTNNSHLVDLDKLNDRLARLDVAKIRQRRRQFNLFYGEVMVSAVPDRGISFNSVLMTLAHYNIINDSKSLKLDEFLKRRARLQRVDEEYRRKVVQGFFDTLYWSRRFKRHMRLKDTARMTAIPQLQVPDIYVEDGDMMDDDVKDNKTVSQPSSPLAEAGSHSFSRDSGAARDSTRNSTWSNTLAQQHPLSLPTSSAWSPSHQSSSSAFSFDIQGPGAGGEGEDEMGRRGSAVSPAQARSMLDDSVWVESIRRSATMRRSDGRSSYRYADLR